MTVEQLSAESFSVRPQSSAWSEMSDVLLRLQRWYASQCDGDWEHNFGVHMETLDNPGLIVKINLVGTELEDRRFDIVSHGLDELSSADWHRLAVENGTFVGAGDPSKLQLIIESFLDWAERILPCTVGR